MATPKRLRRIIACVDGTWYDEDGKEGNYSGNQSSVFRIYASIRDGTFEDDQGRQVEQIVRYFHGIGTQKSPLDKFNDGITGAGCYEQIQEVYKFCAKNIQSIEDEVWLFGFSRGAYVVRVVFVLLSQSTPQLSPDEQTDSIFKKAWKLLPNRKSKPLSPGQVWNFQRAFPLKLHTREPPVLKFLGLFDTVKRCDCGGGGIDISKINPAQYVRHALALNEERAMFLPEMYPDGMDQDGESHLRGPALLQAWFVGAHADMGGGSQHDGLSLYPLQWILIESQKYGLYLKHDISSRLNGLIENPLELIFPERLRPSQNVHENAGIGQQSASTSIPVHEHQDLQEPWTFRYGNSLEIEMIDLRATHNHGNLQVPVKNTLKKPRIDLKSKGLQPSHKIRLNTGLGSNLRLGRRAVFDPGEGKLHGYSRTVRNGTIIHPSVYFLADTYPGLGIGNALKSLKPNLEEFRVCESLKYCFGAMTVDTDPWVQHAVLVPGSSCRILICGNCGVGKSTLLNRVFGVDMTDESMNSMGKHDIDQAFESEYHPGIILHDSEGFQAGNDKEVKAFKRFLSQRSPNADPQVRLHAIWFCIEANNRRPVQTALSTILKLVSEVAPSIPIVIVGTKKDLLLLENRIPLEHVDAVAQGRGTPEQIEAQRGILHEQARIFKERLESEEQTTQLWPILAPSVSFSFVSQDDQGAVKDLIHLMIQKLEDSNVREGMVAAQIQDVDLKIRLAIKKTSSLLRAAVATASLGSGIMFMSTITTPTISRHLCDSIATQCFGISKRKAAELEDIMSRVVWKNLAVFMSQSIGQSLAIWGTMATLTLFTLVGGIPVAIGAPLLEAPAAARMVVKCACDLIIILDAAFREDKAKFINKTRIKIETETYMQDKTIKDNQPFRKTRRQLVHSEINILIPLVSNLAIKVHKEQERERIENGIHDVIEKHRIKRTKLQLIASIDAVREDSMDWSSLSISDISEDKEDITRFQTPRSPA